MNAPAHTPTPWKVFNYKTKVGNYNMGLDIGTNLTAIATVIGEFEKTEVGELAKANAAFIVRACNSHAELLGVLKLAKSHIEHMGSFITKMKAGYSFESIGDHSGILGQLEKAIIKAESEQNEPG